MPREPRGPRRKAAGAPAPDFVVDLRRFSGIEVVWDAVVVEDDPAIRRLVEATLVAAGLSVVAMVDRAEDVFPLLLSNHPDLVVLDDQLAGELRGSDAAARIKLSLPTAKVVLFTGQPPEDVPPGVDVVAAKKTPKALMDAVRAVLEGYS